MQSKYAAGGALAALGADFTVAIAQRSEFGFVKPGTWVRFPLVTPISSVRHGAALNSLHIMPMLYLDCAAARGIGNPVGSLDEIRCAAVAEH